MIVTLGQHRAVDKCLDLLQEVYEQLGVTVLRLPSKTSDAVFHRDVAAWTPFGLIKCRMGKISRRWEPEIWFHDVGITSVYRVGTPDTFEGADLLWLNRREAVLACGSRTNTSGASAIFKWLDEEKVLVHQVNLPVWHEQHLLGLANAINGQFIVCDGQEPWTTDITNSGVIPSTDYDMKGPNWVEIGDAVVVGDCCGQTIEVLQARGKRVLSIDISELLAFGGGIACATGIVSYD